ncbi:MAG: antibiotic biosynthesis monooxygenase [Sneathiella sp.]|nr:antibiotic biosynthesis monooxygenase [Sneathiella sp.]
MNTTRINEFQAAENRGEDLYKFLKSLVPYISSSNGCISCELLRNSDTPGHYVIIEKWDSVQDHKNSVETFPKEEMQKGMTLIANPPRGGYFSE